MKNKKTMLFFALLAAGVVQAQVTNTGTIAVNPNTIMGIVSDFDNQTNGTFLNDGELHLKANFNNEGLVTFTPNENGTTLFKGLLNQKIEGIGATEFQNMVFDNGSVQPAVQLYSDISVAGQVDFTQGIVNNEDFGGLITFEEVATHVNASNNSFVDGKVKNNGDVAFIFPVGQKGEYRYSGIEATNEVLSSFTGNYFLENSNSSYPHSNKTGEIKIINDQEYWTLDKTAGNADAILTLSWDETTTTPPNIVVSPQTDIHIVRWDAAQNSWIDEGGVVDSSNKTVTTPINVSGYSVFTLARVDSFLPCNELVVYNAVTPNGDGLNDYFRIDGLNSCTNGSNTVEIFNRWGVKVFESTNYGENGNVFKGYSNGRATISGDKTLPTGTYFYILNLNTDSGTTKKSGYLYLN